MESWFGGQEEGNALTGNLFGDEAPSGHLPVTFPASERRTGPGQENPWATYNDLDGRNLELSWCAATSPAPT